MLFCTSGVDVKNPGITLRSQDRLNLFQSLSHFLEYLPAKLDMPNVKADFPQEIL
jgi:hypothetical protein